jgi:hypothetical protein
MKLGLHFVVIVKSIDTGAYTQAQRADCALSLKNRHGTRVEHACDDRTLEEHPEWLIQHYIEHGGAVWAAEKLRPRYLKDIEIPVHVYVKQRVKDLVRSLKKVPKKEYTKPRRVLRRLRLVALKATTIRPIDLVIKTGQLVQ